MASSDFREDFRKWTAPIIQDFLETPALRGVKIAHFIAPPIGKSETLVPEIWKQITESQPRVKGAYIQRFQQQAENLQLKLRKNREIVATLVEEDADEFFFVQPGTLYLGSYEKIGPYADFEIKTNQMALMMDLEDEPTPHGELTVACVVDHVRRYIDHKDTDITIVFLSSYDRDDITKLVEHALGLSIAQSIFELQAVTISPVTLTEDIVPSIVAIIKDLIDEHCGGNKTPFPRDAMGTVVLIGDGRIVDDILSQLEKHGRFPFRFQSIMARGGLDKDGFLEEERPIRTNHESYPNNFLLISVHPACQLSFPTRNLRAVISFDRKPQVSYIADAESWLECMVPLSRAELDRHRSWIWKAENPDTEPPQFFATWSEDSYSTAEEVSREELSKQALWLYLEAARIWPDVPFSKGFLPAGHEITSGEWDMARRRLRLLGTLNTKATGDAGAPTQHGQNVLKFYHRLYNNFRASALMSQAATGKSDPSGIELDTPLRRLIIRLACIQAHSPLFRLTEEGRASFQTGSKLCFTFLEAYCRGAAKLHLKRGSAWVELGIWQTLRYLGDLSPHQKSDSIVIAAGHISVDIRRCKRVLRSVVKFEEMLLSQEHETSRGTISDAEELVATDVASTSGFESLETIITWAHLDQLAYFPMRTREEPFDVLTQRRLELSSRCLVLSALDTVDESDQDGDSSSFTAIYNKAARGSIPEAPVQPLDLTRISRRSYADAMAILLRLHLEDTALSEWTHEMIWGIYWG